MPTTKWTGSINPATLTNLGLSPTDCGGGSGSYASCASTINAGLNSSRTYVFETSPVKITSSFGLMGSLTSFRYSIVKPAWSAGATYTMVVELVPWNPSTSTYGTPFRINNNTELVNQTGAVTCGTWQWNPYTPKFDPNPGVLSGDYVIRITVTTTNTNPSTLNCLRFDEIVMDWTILASTASQPNGLTEPTFSTSTGVGSINGSGELIADVTLNKSAQSAVSCSGNGGSATPLCGLSSVAGRYIVMRKSKTTENVEMVSAINLTIPYQSGTWSHTVTGAKHEDANYTYQHWFEVQKWNTGATDLESAFLQADMAKVASTVNISYSAGAWHVNLSQPITGNIEVSVGSVYGSAYDNCSTEDENDYITQDIIVTPGNTYESLSTMGLVTSNYFKVTNSVNVNGATVSNGSTLSIAGHLITVEIANITCSPYDQPAPPEE